MRKPWRSRDGASSSAVAVEQEASREEANEEDADGMVEVDVVVDVSQGVVVDVRRSENPREGRREDHTTPTAASVRGG